MTLLRIILIAIAVYYGIKLLAGWIFRSSAGVGRVKRRKPSRNGDDRYRGLTDQRIDDADYEEIDTEHKP